MNPHPHRGRKWRRFCRQNQSLLFAGFFLILILIVVVVIFWVMTSSRFILK